VRRVHITLQGKGGVGKSLIAALVAQGYLRKGLDVVCVDTDPINATFSGYTAFATRRVELMEGGIIKRARFDSMMEWLLDEDRNFVIDNGASSFVPLSSYLIENDAVSLIGEAGKKVVVHTVITGGQGLLDTLNGFDELAKQLPANADLVVWLNEYFGPVELEGKKFDQMAVYERHRRRTYSVLRIGKASELMNADVELMLTQRLTVDEAVRSPSFRVMQKQRLAMFWKQIASQLGELMDETSPHRTDGEQAEYGRKKAEAPHWRGGEETSGCP